MQLAKLEKVEKRGSEQLNFGPMVVDDLQLLRSSGEVGIFYRGFCIGMFREGDLLTRNFFLVQLHISGKVKLKELSRLFELQYQHCSNIIVGYKRFGLEGVKDNSSNSAGNREIISGKIAKLIKELKGQGKSYKEIAQVIRFRFKKKIKADSIRCWVYRQKKEENGVESEPEQLEMSGEDIEEGIAKVSDFGGEGESHWNGYAGSLILYGMIMRSQVLEVFSHSVEQEKSKLGTAKDVRRIILTLFFMHALRCRSVEQGKHLQEDDFGGLVGGDYCRLQWLRYAVDEIVESKGFEKAIEGFYQRLIEITDEGDGLYYTDGHFSTYYGKRKVPKGYDPRRQMPYRGRNTIYLHNSRGENVYLFESPTNTTLSNDIEELVKGMEKLKMELKGKTLAFDRGGFSIKCFRFLRKRKMYWITYLKNRKKERLVEVDKFQTVKINTGFGKLEEYRLYEQESRETRYGKVRVVILLGNKGKQIPILSTNPHLKPEQIVYRLKRRWREENCFKYMTEHFGVDLLTTYKTESAPDKVIERVNPERKGINNLISKKKKEIESFEAELAKRLVAVTDGGKTIDEFNDEQKDLRFAVKNEQVELDRLLRIKEVTPSKQKSNLKDDHVIIAQKRRLFMNAIKALNYNAEKWLQGYFEQHHRKQDETLSLIRSVFRQPGRIRHTPDQIQVELEPLAIKRMGKSLDGVLKNLNDNNLLSYFDGRKLIITQTQ